MLKSRTQTSRNGMAFRFVFDRNHMISSLMLTLILLVSFTAPATQTDDQYYRIYGIIEQADELDKAGQAQKAKAKYAEAEKALRELRQYHPSYNPKLVSARLTYLAEKIVALSQPVKTNVVVETSTTAPAKIIAPGQPQVTLLEAGAEPRQVFRMQGKPMDKQAVTMTAKISTGLSAPEIPGEMMKMPGVTIKATITTKDVAADGSINYELSMDDVLVSADAGVMPQVAEAMKQSLAGIKGLIVLGSMTDRYVSKKAEAKIPAGVDAQTREAMEQMKESFANAEFVLPEEAIGVGAKWEVKEKNKMQGMTIEQSTQHELVALEEGRLILKSSATLSAANQKIPNPLMPAAKVDMTKLTGTTKGTATVDLTRVFPSKATSDERVEMNMSVNAGGKRQTLTMKNETLATLETQ